MMTKVKDESRMRVMSQRDKRAVLTLTQQQPDNSVGSLFLISREQARKPVATAVGQNILVLAGAVIA